MKGMCILQSFFKYSSLEQVGMEYFHADGIRTITDERSIAVVVMQSVYFVQTSASESVNIKQ